MSLPWLIPKPENVWLHFSGDLDANQPAKESKGWDWEQEPASSWCPEPGCDSGTVPETENGGWQSAAGGMGKDMKEIVGKLSAQQDSRQLLSRQEFPLCNMKNLQNKHKQLLLPDYK